MMRTIEFAWYLFCAGVLIAALHFAEVRPWAELVALIGCPFVIGVSVWFFAADFSTRRGSRSAPQRARA